METARWILPAEQRADIGAHAECEGAGSGFKVLGELGRGAMESSISRSMSRELADLLDEMAAHIVATG